MVGGFHPGRQLGEVLLARGLLKPAQLREALALQVEWGSRLGDIVLAKGWIRALDFYTALAEHYGRPFVNLLEAGPDARLLRRDEIPYYTELLVLPWRRRGKRMLLATADPGPAVEAFARQRWGDEVDFVVTSKFDIIWLLQHNQDDYLSQQAVYELAERMPERSARLVFTFPQLLGMSLVGYLLMLCLALWPIPSLIGLNILVSLFLLINFGLRVVLVWVGGDHRIDIKVTEQMVTALEDKELPVYTILVPMYREPSTLPVLSSALRRMDYPLSKLDIKLILEEDDTETIESAKALALESTFEIIRVPDSLPKTKPKACNYALNFARGELVTIYDAEDKPEADQLKRAVAAFRNSSRNTACIQARLNYFNQDENWLTRMFTMEYSLWFDFYLPALEALRVPIPLGGTSNHFRMQVLREVDAWDPFNVTEDADLGVRFTQLGYRVGVVNSTTFEEANNHLGNWVRQRSRWIKGYMQTYLVHMRSPTVFYRSVGRVGFWGFQFFIGGTVINALLTPWLFGMYLVWLLTQTQALDVIFPPLLLYISLFNLLFGNGFFIYVTALGAFKRRYFRLIPYAITVPFYWVLMSIAAYKALWQLIHDPFYWEKTRHGLSSFEHHDLKSAQD
ncbi:MAG: glycosyltransferase [Gammaproteobacteria bacterium]|nr:glycosyltransferase [Gammaproteobacteria bacterium]